VQLVTRADLGWPATPAADQPTTLGVKVHYEGGAVPTALVSDHSQCVQLWKNIRSMHMSDPVQGWVDIAYNFGACPHGYVLEGRGLHKETGANGNQPLNHAHYAVCGLLGSDSGGLTQPNDAMLNGLRDAIEYLQANGAGPEIKGHRDGYATDCPGDPLYAWVQRGAPRPGAGSAPAPAPQPTPHPAPAPAPAPAPSGNAPAWPGEDLSVRSPMLHDDNVRTWQQRMADRGWSITVDGWYGPASAGICRQFQQDSTDHGWPLTVDGVVGPKTWAAAWQRPVTY
jgi:hypothetical protein